MYGLVLVADNETSFRESLCNYLLMSGYEYILASDTDSIIALTKKNNFNLIIMNIFFNNKSIVETIRELKEDNLDCKMIIISNTLEELDNFSSEIGNGIDYVLKPRILELLPQLLQKQSSNIKIKKNNLTQITNDKEKRQHKRAKVDLPVNYYVTRSYKNNEDNDKKLSELTNICPQGAMIVVDTSLNMQELLDIEILLPPSFRPIRMYGQIKWSKELDNVSKHYQVGIKFLDTPKYDKSKMEQFLTSLL
ncbi:MAG: response regulator [bacterium]